MKTITLIILFLLPPALSAKEVELSELNSVAENLQLFIAPSNEGDYEKFDQLCECVAKSARNNWGKEKFFEFSKSLNDYNKKVESAMTNMEEILKNGPPRPSETVIVGLQDMASIIESCEEKFDMRVEF